MATLRDCIDWVGYVDWTVRDFHGYRTEHGFTYNAYLIRDEKTVLIDTVKAGCSAKLLGNIVALVPLEKVDYVVCNHAEPDHAGSLPAVLAACPNAVLLCDAKCREALSRYHETDDWSIQVVADGETLSIGKRTLQFFETPMVHWPESMATYVPEEKLLFSMDGFGQHYASSSRFDDQTDIAEIMAGAKTYYANILMLYGAPIKRTLARLSELPIEMIAPSHGVVWRKHVGDIVAAYNQWVDLKSRPKVVVIYDTMWKSTERMAWEIYQGAIDAGAEAKIFSIRASNITVLAREVLDAAAVAFGSATLNNTIMPEAAAALTYLKGLKPRGKAGVAFGSYGWATTAGKELTDYLTAMQMEIVREPVMCRFGPDEAVLAECRAAGEALGVRAIELAGD